MQDYETTMTEKGQVTIPLAIRRIMGLHPHDKVSFEVEGDVVRIRRTTSKLLKGYGAVTPKNRPENFREIRERFEEGVAEEVISEAKQES